MWFVFIGVGAAGLPSPPDKSLRVATFNAIVRVAIDWAWQF